MRQGTIHILRRGLTVYPWSKPRSSGVGHFKPNVHPIRRLGRSTILATYCGGDIAGRGEKETRHLLFFQLFPKYGKTMHLSGSLVEINDIFYLVIHSFKVPLFRFQAGLMIDSEMSQFKSGGP